ncbi:hypothetical protein [Microbacterium sp.]|uniref:hypothetical protein n=1 Tax=Microbacterium sp. TaxID=51671 RepID=UPI002810AF07|nr:hypothetical protein [Microbacterium sp.]
MTGQRFLSLQTIVASVAAGILGASILVASPVAAASTGFPGVVSMAASSGSATATHAAAPNDITKAANLASFRPGNIIADAVFFNPSTMSSANIDSFLRSKVSSCRAGYVCLKDYRQNTPNRSADAYCRGYSGAGNESAATIIAKVAQSCGINPQVLVVMLEKEQSLVTHTFPSQGRFNIAMGQGCPDTAGCDPGYLGFFYQVYGAARQMKIYAEGRWFTYYAPGRTWNILYHPRPERNCGSSPVYVENTATAALYYYTPYQPNRAALTAGYGEGDRCSSYGNRNFYQFFTDWFGSTQASALIHGAGQADIYLVSAGTKHRVSTLEDLAVFRSRFGSVTEVSAEYANSLPRGGDASRYVHDPRTGTLYVLDPDGTKHRFLNPEQIARFGYAFSSYVNLAPTLIDQFTTGAEVTNFFRIWDGPDLYVFESGKKRHIASYSMWQLLSRGTSGYVAFMPSGAATALPMGPVALEPNTLIRPASTGEVYLLLSSNTLLHIPSFALAAEFGASRYMIVPDSSVSANLRAKGSLTPIVQCAGATKIAAGGKIHAVTGTDFGGIAPAVLSAQDCGAFAPSTSTYATPLFLQAAGHPEVYAVGGGKLKHVRSYAVLQSLNGGRPLSLITWSKATVTDVGVGSSYLADKEFVSFTGRGEIYQYTEGQLRHVRDYSTLLSLNGGRVPSITSLKADWLPDYKMGAPILSSGTFVQFDGLPEVFFFSDGQLRHVQSYASLVRLANGRPLTIVKLPAANKGAYVLGTPIP